MPSYLLLPSQDPFRDPALDDATRMACGLAQAGHSVSVFLVENSVLGARASAPAPALQRLADAGVSVRADQFALAERGVSADRLVAGVQAAPLDHVVDELAAGHKALWF